MQHYVITFVTGLPPVSSTNKTDRHDISGVKHHNPKPDHIIALKLRVINTGRFIFPIYTANSIEKPCGSEASRHLARLRKGKAIDSIDAILASTEIICIGYK
jgi:hypothetical protein